MGHKTLYAAVMFSLLSAVSTLHAEEPATTQSSDPAMEESSPSVADESTTPSLTPEAIINPTSEAPAEVTTSPDPEQASNETAPSTAETETPPAPQESTTAEKQPAVMEKTTGDTLAIPKSPAQKPATAQPEVRAMPQQDVTMPARGSSMSDVEKRFGKPKRKLAPVGQPPITRWIYEHYTVYFEHQFVIEAVKNQPHRAAPAKALQKPAKPQSTKPAATPASAAPSGEMAPAPDSQE